MNALILTMINLHVTIISWMYPALCVMFANVPRFRYCNNPEGASWFCFKNTGKESIRKQVTIRSHKKYNVPKIR